MRKRLRDKLSAALPLEELGKVYNSFDVIGDIAIIKINTLQNAETIAKQIMATQKNIKTVLTPTTSIMGDFRVRELKHLAGENKTITTHKEWGCTFKVDVEKCYFSPRLSHEHFRIAKLVQSDETVVNMFAGVGCFSIVIAKVVKSARVFSIDVNPAAVNLMRENIRLNRVYRRVIPLLGDAKEIVQRQLKGEADRVLMPLPEKAWGYLPVAVSALKPSGGWIHVHVFVHATKTESPTEKVQMKVAKALASLSIDFEIPIVRIVRRTGPNWFQLVADVHLSA